MIFAGMFNVLLALKAAVLVSGSRHVVGSPVQVYSKKPSMEVFPMLRTAKTLRVGKNPLPAFHPSPFSIENDQRNFSEAV